MTGFGIALGFAGYTVALWGYCLFRGYDVTVTQLFSTTWPPGAPAASTTTPPINPPGQNIPNQHVNT